jgi:hypothetical protein
MGAGAGVSVLSGASRGAVISATGVTGFSLEALSLTGGDAGDEGGGGLRLEDSEAVVTDTSFSKNDGASWGGGILVGSGQLHLRRDRLRGQRRGL